jgi:Predicted membrane protein
MGRELLSLIIAGGAFCGSHVLLSSTRLRGSLRDQLGERGFLAVYSVTALVIFAWFVSAYVDAPTIVLWPRQRWTALVPVLVMPLATILLVAGYSTPNPTAVGMERSAGADDPAPGLLRVTRHPVMWAIGLWAISHVIANGDAGLGAVLRRARWLGIRRHGADRPQEAAALGSNWPRLAEATSNLPFAALLAGRTRLRWRDVGLLRVAAGLLLYAVLYLAHPIITGLPVMIP